MSKSKSDSRAGVGGRCFQLWPRLVNAVFACLLWGTTATAADWYVDDVTDPLEDGSQLHPYDTIQEGIDAAAIGDTVLVLDGTYSGTGNQEMSFGGKDITVRSLNGASGCVIDCPGDADPRRAFLFLAGETLAATRTVDNHIVSLRRKLEPDPKTPRHILTVHSIGYRFVP